MLSDYNFDPHDQTALTHITRHVAGSGVSGSSFFADVFPDAESVVRYVLQLLHDNPEAFHDYAGEPQAREFDAGRPIGYDALVQLATLPESASVRDETRGSHDNYTVSVVSGIEKPTTPKLVVVIGPPRDADKHVFYTIHPGKNAPPFPLSEEALRKSGLTGEPLQKAIADNVGNEQFWSQHGFVDDGS